MSKRLNRMRGRIIGASLIWSAVIGWFALVQIPESDLYTKESPPVQARMEAECTGSYQERYDCKNMVAIEVTNHSLMQVSMRIALTILGPCFGLWYYRELKRREPPPPPPPGHITVVHDDMSWKSAAKSHISTAKNPDQPSE